MMAMNKELKDTNGTRSLGAVAVQRPDEPAAMRPFAHCKVAKAA